MRLWRCVSSAAPLFSFTGRTWSAILSRYRFFFGFNLTVDRGFTLTVPNVTTGCVGQVDEEVLAGKGEHGIFLYDRATGKLLPTPGLNSNNEEMDPFVMVLGTPR